MDRGVLLGTTSSDGRVGRVGNRAQEYSIVFLLPALDRVFYEGLRTASRKSVIRAVSDQLCLGDHKQTGNDNAAGSFSIVSVVEDEGAVETRPHIVSAIFSYLGNRRCLDGY